MGFKMKGFGGYHGKKKSTFKSTADPDLARRQANREKELGLDDQFLPASTDLRRNWEDYTSEITDVDEWIKLRDKYPPKENWKYTDKEWKEIVLPHDDVYYNIPDKELHRDRLDWDRRKPEIDTDMEDVEVKPPRSRQYGTSSKDLKNVSYKDRSRYNSWKRQLAQQGYRGAQIDNSYEAFLRGDMPDPSLSRIGRLKEKGSRKYKDYEFNPNKGEFTEFVGKGKYGKWQKGDKKGKKKKKWKDTKVGRSLSGIDLSQLGAQTKAALDNIFGGV